LALDRDTDDLQPLEIGRIVSIAGKEAREVDEEVAKEGSGLLF
jgi:hypothetical protein